MQQQAVKYCQKRTANQLQCLLVKGQDGISVWIQTTNHDETKLEAEPQFDSNNQNNLEIEESNNSQKKSPSKISLKKTTRIYRGQTYNVVIADNCSTKNSTQQQLPKKDRGQYIN